MKTQHRATANQIDIMNDLFGQIFHDWPLFSPKPLDRSAMILRDRDDDYLLNIDLPGVPQKDVDVTVENDVLTIRARRENEYPEGNRIHRQERGSLHVTRRFTLPADADAKSVKAAIQNGVLTLTIAKEKQAEPQRISVEIH